MNKQILVLPGDGIGPEIMAEAVKVLNLANEKYNLGFELSFDDLGGAAIDRYGVPLADGVTTRSGSSPSGTTRSASISAFSANAAPDSRWHQRQ